MSDSESLPLAFDTHCHIHEAVRPVTPVYEKWQEKGDVDIEAILGRAREAGVQYMVCIGTTVDDSTLAVEFVQGRADVYASIGIHPHEAAEALKQDRLQEFAALAERPKVVAVGECGLDYFYNHSPKEAQVEILKFQLQLAQQHNLPVSFHVREAFDDFWPIFEQYPGIRGVLHSYTDNLENLQKAINHGLHIGVNGIATFAKNEDQRVIYRTIPQQLLLLETDAPFLTPTPFRGNICEPKHVIVTAEFVSKLREEPLAQMIVATTKNARALFAI